MKYLFLVIALFIGPVCMAHSDENFIKSDLFGNLGERDKAAILIIHFGTTHDDTRVLTIDQCKDERSFSRYRSPGSLDLPDYPEEIEGKGSRTPESDPGTHSAA